MTGLSAKKNKNKNKIARGTSSCHSANAKLTMKTSKTEHTLWVSDRGWIQWPRCCRWSDKATPQPCANTSARDLMQITTPHFPRSRSRSSPPLVLARNTRSDRALQCVVSLRGFRLGFQFGSWRHFLNKNLGRRAEQHIRDFDSVASSTWSVLFSSAK